MEIKSLQTFKKILETGSFQNAARALNYAQSTVTFQIRQLESELGVKLFEKIGHRMELTQAGHAVLPLVDKVLEAHNELLSFTNDSERLRGTLRIALPESLMTYRIQPVLKRFKELAPEVKLSLKVMNCFAIYEQARSMDADIVLHYDVGQYPASFVTQTLCTYPLALVCSPMLDEKERDFISANQYKSISHIQNDPNALFLKLFDAYLSERHIVLNSRLDVWSIEAIKNCVLSNLGVALLPRFTVQKELDEGLMSEIKTVMPECSITAIYAYRKTKWVSPAMKLFLSLLKEHLSD